MKPAGILGFIQAVPILSTLWKSEWNKFLVALFFH